MASPRDYYEVLGVSRDADAKAIKSAYRKLAMKYHPDRNKEEAAVEQFKEVSEAYAVLSDEEKRQTYDRYGHAGFDERYSQEDIFRGADFSEFGFDLGNIFRSIFGGSGGFGGGPVQGRDLLTNLDISLEEVAKGGVQQFRVTRLEACETCRGSGAKPGTSPKRCPQCQGQGQVAQTMRTPFGLVQAARPCPACGGRGEVVSDPDPACQGQGRQRKTRTLEVNVPQGVPHDGTLRLRGEGEAGPMGTPPGDLYVKVRVKRHEVFVRDGNDLHLAIPLTFSQVALGDAVDVPLIGGGRDTIHVPAGTQAGEVFRLRGKGLPHLGGGRRGDLLATARVYTPQKLSPEQRDLFEQLATLDGVEPKGEKGSLFRDLKKKLS